MKTRKRGGNPLPLRYFDPKHSEPFSSEGRDLLESGSTIRPAITVKGGTKTRGTKRTKRTKGGFVPSIMEGFVAMASKYIVPLSVFSGYKFMTKKRQKGIKRKR
jgi:hypothetical protein